jgi:hypothetical protein
MRWLISARVWLWLTAGWSALFSLGLMATAVDWGGTGGAAFLAYSIFSTSFFLVIVYRADALARSPRRRMLARVAAAFNFLVCVLGMLSGFLFFGASLAVLVVLGFAKPPITARFAD